MKRRRRRRRRDETKNVNNFGTQNSTVTSVETLKPRSFFKLMLSPTSQSQFLRIPEKFARAYHEELCVRVNVVLSVPTGEAWSVTLVEDDNKLWFREGWNDFVNNYSIDYGYFMLFRYEGNLRFNVHVFDLTACEISYRFEGLRLPLRKRIQNDYSDAQVVKSEGEDDDDEDYAMEDESSDHRSGTLITKQGLSRLKVDSEDDEMDSQEGTDTRYDSQNEVRCSKLEAELPNWLKSFKTKLKHVIVAGFPIPANPFFVAVIRPYHLTSCGFMYVPQEFARMYLNRKGKEQFIVELSDGSQCKVRCVKKARSFSLGQGWQLAAQRARLEVGNLCFLELIDDKNWVLKLHAAKFGSWESVFS